MTRLKLLPQHVVMNRETTQIQSLLQEFSELFSKELGTFNKGTFTISLKKDAKPASHKPRPLPFAIKQKVEEELDRLVSNGILEPVEVSDFTAPIVPVLKKDNSVKICGDYSGTINHQIEAQSYPLPRVEYLFEKFQGGEKSSKIDLSTAYLQVKLNDKSKRLTTISTHKGRFQFTRIPYRITPCADIFQKYMDRLLGTMEGVVAFLDDLCFTGKNDRKHIENVTKVFQQLRNCGLRVQKSKCVFMQDKVECLGHLITKDGIQTSPTKVKALEEASPPKNQRELQSFLGPVNYYEKFIPNKSELLAPLTNLTKKEVPWNFDEDCFKTFTTVKKVLTSAPVLAHYSHKGKLTITCDAGPNGIGAVLSRVFNDGSERPIAFSSRTLSKSERNYSQIHKEALALVFGVQKFHQYVYLRKFVLKTDHKPLLAILSPGKGIPQMTSSRFQRFALKLVAYDFELKYVKPQIMPAMTALVVCH